MNTSEINLLKNVVKEIVAEALTEWTKLHRISELLTARQVGKIFQVTSWTVLDWQKKGLLKGRVQLLSGRAYRMMFEGADVVDFMKQNLPRPEDFSTEPCDPRTSKAKRAERFLRMEKLYRRRRKA